MVYPCGLPLWFTLVVYPCVLDLGLLRMGCLTHILFGSKCSRTPTPCELYALLMVLDVFRIGMGSFQSAVHVKYVEIIAKVSKYYLDDCRRVRCQRQTYDAETGQSKVPCSVPDDV